MKLLTLCIIIIMSIYVTSLAFRNTCKIITALYVRTLVIYAFLTIPLIQFIKVFESVSHFGL